MTPADIAAQALCELDPRWDSLNQNQRDTWLHNSRSGKAFRAAKRAAEIAQRAEVGAPMYKELWERFVSLQTGDARLLVEDAARYRWLRDLSVPPHNFYIAVPDEFKGVRYTPQEVDAAIDAARQRTSGPSSP